MKKKIVGVMPLWDSGRESLWMLPGYLDGIIRAGGLPVIFPLGAEEEGDAERLCDLCGGFLFTGGQDVDPRLYGERPLPETGEISPRRDALERAVLAYALERGRPVLGICRGIQFINAALGGTLYQDLPTQFPSGTEHRMSPPYGRRVHDVRVVPDTPLYRLLGAPVIGVNSYHHQAVKDPAPGLRVMARSEDGLIEGLYMEDRDFVWGVQWHPEFYGPEDRASRLIFGAFVDRCL